MNTITNTKECNEMLASEPGSTVQFPANANVLLCQKSLPEDAVQALEDVATTARRSLHLR